MPRDLIPKLRAAGCRCADKVLSVTFASGPKAEGIVPIRERTCVVLPIIGYADGYWYCHGCDARVRDS